MKKKPLPQNPALSPQPIENMQRKHIRAHQMEGQQGAKQKWQI
jgi:hypothetical protein